MTQPRNNWLYVLRDGHRIVYYGITKDPDGRSVEHTNSRKRFTHMAVVSAGLTRISAEDREGYKIQRYQRQHCGRPPKYNHRKIYQLTSKEDHLLHDSTNELQGAG